MTVGFRQQFEKDLHQLKDHVLKKRILKAIHQAEQAPTLTELAEIVWLRDILPYPCRRLSVGSQVGL